MYLIYNVNGTMRYIHELSKPAMKARIKHMLEEGTDFESLELRQILNHGGEVIITDRYQPLYNRNLIQEYLKED